MENRGSRFKFGCVKFGLNLNGVLSHLPRHIVLHGNLAYCLGLSFCIRWTIFDELWTCFISIPVYPVCVKGGDFFLVTLD